MPFEHFVDAEDFDQTGRNLEEEVNIVANILAQSDVKEFFVLFAIRLGNGKGKKQCTGLRCISGKFNSFGLLFSRSN